MAEEIPELKPKKMVGYVRKIRVLGYYVRVEEPKEGE